MKIMITIIGLLIVLAGVLPFLGEEGLKVLPSTIPTTGTGYSIIVIVIGAAGLLYGFINKMIMGIERVVTVTVALLTVLGGILPLISSAVPNFIPTTGPLYYGFIIIVGLVGVVYGVMGLG